MYRSGLSKVGGAVVLALGMSSSPVLAATTECSGKLQSVYVGDEGHLWLHFQNGLHAHVAPSHPDQKQFLALATSALLADRWLKVRYVTSLGPAVCSLGFTDAYLDIPVQGIYLLAGQP